MIAQTKGFAPLSPEAQLENPPPALKVRLQKTKLCQFHLRSACKDGSACRFAHGPEELVKQPDLSKTSMCPDVLAGKQCTQPFCQYAHSPDEIRATNFCYKTTQCMWYAMGKCRNGTNCRFAHGEADCNPLLNAVNPREKVAEDRAMKNKKRQQQPQQQKAKDLTEPMFIKPDVSLKSMVNEVQAPPSYLTPPHQVMGYPMSDTTHLLPPPGLAGVWNLAPMMQHTGTLYNDAYYNALSAPAQIVPESTAELSNLFDHIKILTEQVKNLQDSVNQNMRSDSDCSTYSGANERGASSETSETSSHDLDNVWSAGQMVNPMDNKLA